MEKYSVDELEKIAFSHCDDLENCKGCKMLYATIQFIRQNPKRTRAILQEEAKSK